MNYLNFIIYYYILKLFKIFFPTVYNSFKILTDIKVFWENSKAVIILYLHDKYFFLDLFKKAYLQKKSEFFHQKKLSL